MLPRKHYLLMCSYIIVGGSILCLLLFSFYNSLGVPDGRHWAWVWGGISLAYIAVVLFILGTLVQGFNLYTRALTRGDPKKKWIALTFDDGPNEPHTSKILDILRDKNVPATFFLLGENIRKNPQVVQRMARENHSIGNHTVSHRPLPLRSKHDILNDFEEWERVMEGIGATFSKIFRAPRGWKSPHLPGILRKRKYRLIGWTRGVWDTDQPGEDVIASRIKRNISNGEIVLLHDGKSGESFADQSQTVAALPKVIDSLRQQGYQFVTIDSMLEGALPN